MPSLTVIIITKNEEKLIQQCLESVKWADEIIVLDSGSTDKTVEIAKKYTSHVYITDWPGYGIQKQRALSYATGDWILNVDADEEVTEPLKNRLLQVMQESLSKQIDACRIPIALMFYEKMMKYSWRPKRHIRFFKRLNAAYNQNIVHEHLFLPPDSQIIQLHEPIRHYCFRDLNHALYKLNRYSSYTAKMRLQEGRTCGLSRAIANSSWMFFRCYFMQLGFLDGKPGLLLAILSAEGSFYRSIKQLYHEDALDDLPSIK